MAQLFTPTNYFTLADNHIGEALFKEKGSKFLSFAYHVKTEEDVKNYFTQLKKKYFDATHHCYAYQLGVELVYQRANDDGEPNGTAGLPILNQIKSKKLTYVLVVVVRYYGGTKLGASGLVSAYKTATQLALENALIVEKMLTKTIRIDFDYLAMNEVMKIIKDDELKILQQHFDNQCTMTLEIPKKVWEQSQEKLSTCATWVEA
jgi:uncharacterized YigZ family protein